MAMPVLDAELWKVTEPLLPPPKPRWMRGPCPQPLARRKVLTGIVCILKRGIPWVILPRECGCGSGMTCGRSVRAWQRLHAVILAKWREAASIGRVPLCTPRRAGRLCGGKPGPNSTERRQLWSQHQVMTKAQGIPLAVILTGANTRDVTPLVPRVEVMPSVRGKRGRPRRQSERVDGDRGDDSEPNRDTLRTHGITLGLAKPGTPHGGGLGVERYSRPP